VNSTGGWSDFGWISARLGTRRAVGAPNDVRGMCLSSGRSSGRMGRGALGIDARREFGITVDITAREGMADLERQPRSRTLSI
jgi:hypothetical protein